MSRWSGRRGQVEPLAALAAVFAVGVGLALYAGAIPEPAPSTDRVAETTLQRAEGALLEGGVADAGRLDAVAAAAPSGYHLNATLVVGDRRLTTGPPAPARASEATGRVGVRTAPGVVRPGRLTVVVWP